MCHNDEERRRIDDLLRFADMPGYVGEQIHDAEYCHALLDAVDRALGGEPATTQRLARVVPRAVLEVLSDEDALFPVPSALRDATLGSLPGEAGNPSATEVALLHLRNAAVVTAVRGVLTRWRDGTLGAEEAIADVDQAVRAMVEKHHAAHVD